MTEPVDTQRAEILQRIDIGMAAENFLRSDCCKFLTRRADRERAELVEQLVRADAADEKANRDIRFRIAVLDCWQQFIAETQIDGDNAQMELQRMDVESGD